MDTAHTLTPTSTEPFLHPVTLGPERGISMESFIHSFDAHHVNQLVVAAEMRGTIRLYFSPLERYALSEITPLIIEAWVHDIGRHSHSQANKSLSILRTMFERAKDWRLYEGENPARRVQLYPTRARTRFVQPKEMPRLMFALKREDEATQCYFLLCLLVGCRRTEGLTMQWNDLDVESGVWNKPKTKTGIPHTVPVPLSLMSRIAALPRLNEFVFSTIRGLGRRRWCTKSGVGFAQALACPMSRSRSPAHLCELARDPWRESCGDRARRAESYESGPYGNL